MIFLVYDVPMTPKSCENKSIGKSEEVITLYPPPLPPPPPPLPHISDPSHNFTIEYKKALDNIKIVQWEGI